MDAHPLLPGDVILTSAAPLGRSRPTIVTSQIDWVPGPAAVRDPDRQASAAMVGSFTTRSSSSPVHGIYSRRATGTTPGHSPVGASRVQVPLPPLDEQRAIAHILGTLDDKIELNRRMNETLETIARALFKSWFIDFDPQFRNARSAGDRPRLAELPPGAFTDSELGPIPSGWYVGTLGQVADVIDCSHAKKPERQASGKPLLQLANIGEDGSVDTSELYLVSDSDYQAWTSRIEASPERLYAHECGSRWGKVPSPRRLQGGLGEVENAATSLSPGLLFSDHFSFSKP